MLKLTSGYGSDTEITGLIDQYDWKFVPISNPDGYVFTWTDVRRAIKSLNLEMIVFWRIAYGEKIASSTTDQSVAASI